MTKEGERGKREKEKKRKKGRKERSKSELFPLFKHLLSHFSQIFQKTSIIPVKRQYDNSKMLNFF